MKADAMKNLEQFSEMNQVMLNGFVKLNEILSSRMEQFLKLHNAVINDSLETGMQYFKALGDIKKPEEAMSSQMAYFNEASKKAVDNAKKYFSLALETNAEMNSAFQQNVETMTGKAAAKKAA